MKQLKLFLALLPVFLALDLAWLGGVMRGFYRRELGSLARLRDGALAPNWLAACLVYILLVAGMVAFVWPRIEGRPGILGTILLGAGYGLVVYGVYDLTNYSMLAGWSLRMSLTDIAWGCMVCGLCAVIMKQLAGWIF